MQYVKHPSEQLCHHAIIDLQYTHTALVLTSQHYLAKPALAIQYY